MQSVLLMKGSPLLPGHKTNSQRSGSGLDIAERSRRGRTERRLFGVALTVRLLVVAVICLAPSVTVVNLSRDSAKYHARGIAIAAEFARGSVEWSRWLDDGWYQFVGLVYYAFGPHLGLVMAINACLAAAATVLVYRVAWEVFHDETTARASGYVFALFPSLVYYTSLPLKESASLAGVLTVVWGVLCLINRRGHRGWISIAVGVGILSGLRIYLAAICLGCAAVCLLPIRLRRGGLGVLQVGTVLLVGLLLARTFVLDTSGQQPQHGVKKYFDVNYINHVRTAMTRGNARMYQNADGAVFGRGWANDAKLVANGFFYFLFSVDVTNIKRGRQLAAIPEMLFFLYCLPYIVIGVRRGWNTIPRRILPILLFGAVIAGAYSSAATNLGALYRWRAQALPFVIMLIAYGAVCRQRGILFALMRSLGRKRRSRIGSRSTRHVAAAETPRRMSPAVAVPPVRTAAESVPLTAGLYEEVQS